MFCSALLFHALAILSLHAVYAANDATHADEPGNESIMALVQTHAQLLSKPSRGNGPLYVYVAIGKTGSSTMRNVMKNYNKKHGNLEFCKCVHPSCKAKQTPDCATEPDSYFLEGAWGYCDAIKGTRPCKYVNLLREPVSRMISAYNFWCLGCAEQNKYCGRCGPHTCPNMNIVEFTKRYGNHYTRKFAASSAPNDFLDGGDWFTKHGLTDAGFTRKLTDSDFHSALKHLQSNAVENFALEDPKWPHDLAVLLGDSASSIKDTTHENGHTGDYEHVPSSQERREMERILNYDIRLYNALFGHIEKNFLLGRLEDLMDDEFDEDGDGDSEFMTV